MEATTEVPQAKKVKLNRNDVLRKMLGIIAAYQKQGLTLTVRQLYYRLVATYGLKNCLSSYQFVGDVLKDARLDGTIPFEAIEDRTRAIHFGEKDEQSVAAYFRSYWDYLQNMEENYTMPRWWNQPERVVVVVEKQAMQGVFQSVTDRYGVDLIVNRGYPSLTLMWNLANRLKAFQDGDDGAENVHIIYFGDFDPSGMDMDRHVQETQENDFGVDVDLLRIAITREQIDKWHIPPAPAKKGDSRRANFILEQGVDWQVELDAIEPAQLQELIKNAIQKHFDPKIFEERNLERERRRAIMKEWADEWLNADFVPPEASQGNEDDDDSEDDESDDEDNDEGDDNQE